MLAREHGIIFKGKREKRENFDENKETQVPPERSSLEIKGRQGGGIPGCVTKECNRKMTGMKRKNEHEMY